jgi:hypothetical protein
MVAKWVSGDLLQWFLPAPIRRFDRSSAMETAFAAASNEHVQHDSMVETFTTAARQPDDVPVLLLNSTSVQQPPHRREPACGVVGCQRRRAGSNRLSQAHRPRRQLATAVHNRRAFRISAAGWRAQRRRRAPVDGGYFENTGATLIDVLRYLRQAASPLSVRFIAVVLLNSPPEHHLTDPTRIPWHETPSLGGCFRRCARCCKRAPPAAI